MPNNASIPGPSGLSSDASEPIAGPSGLSGLSSASKQNSTLEKKFCSFCKVKVDKTNWPRHLRTEKHKRKSGGENQHLKLKDLQALGKQYGLKGVSGMKKKELEKIIEKIEDEFFKKDDLQKLKMEELGNLAEKSQSKQSEIIETVLKNQNKIFKDRFLLKEPSFDVETLSSRYIKKWSTTQARYKILLKRPTEVEKAIFGMLRASTEKAHYKPGDRVQIIAQNPVFFHDISVVLETRGRFGIISKEHVGKFIETLNNIIDSNTSIDVTQITFLITVTNIPRGAARRKIVNLKEDKHAKRSIIEIKNRDNLCCPRAIITGLTYPPKIKKKDHPRMNSSSTTKILGRDLTRSNIRGIRTGRKLQKVLAMELCNKLKYYNKEGFTLDDIKKVELLLDIQIRVICFESSNTVIYRGVEKETKIYLYKNGNHFDLITKLTGFFNSSYYCKICDTPYQNKGAHACKKIEGENVCPLCSQVQHPRDQKSKIYCKGCNRYCYNQQCLDSHSRVCKKWRKCLKCNKLCKRADKHKCGSGKCRNCHQFFEKIREHKCYMMPKRQKGGYCEEESCFCKLRSGKKSRSCTYTEKYIFFDYEANQETGTHEANLVVAWHVPDGTEHVFKTNNAFCKWLISNKHKGFTAIAHNAKGYDSHFILKYCVENGVKPVTIYSGSKLMLLEIKKANIKVIDSANFVASPLSAFPTTFNLKETKKGYFPHYFNKAEYQNYVGPIPDVEFYGVDTMKSVEREKFLEWHKQRKEEKYVFNFQNELLEYCKSDVDILRRGCMELRKQFLEIANVDPFQYMTIASVCMAIYRSKYLRENMIASIKKNRKETFSIGSITWLRKFPSVRHACNGGEVTICGAKVDGFDKSTNTVYQYHGCFWHGCPKCFDEDIFNNVKQENMGDLYEKAKERSKQIRDAGYTLVEMWECEWVKTKEYKTAKRKNGNIVESLEPRDAFYGGRTDASKLKVMNKKLQYIDVCSLYPTVQYFDYYPVGHPEKFLNPKTYDPTWYGLIKCKVLAPKELYHPVLPIKDEKLLFVLCLKCFDEKSYHCAHTKEERAMVGTWTTDEVKKAIEKGYEIIDVYEVWHFKEKRNDLFKGYVEDFMKIKLATSPWEGNFATVEDYSLAVKQCLNIELLPKNIKPNPRERAVAKICLNSLWGKFGQRSNKSKTEYVTEVKTWFDLLLDDRLEISSCVFLNNDNMVQVTYKYLDEFVEDCYKTNVFVAVFTTSSARLRLYDMLDKLGDRAVYYDTDSVVYIDDGSCDVKTGCMLGEWVNELGKDDHITEWISTGPKSYVYTLNSGKEVAKVKGFTLNYENSQRLNMKTMREIVEENSKRISLKQNTIDRDKKSKTLVNRDIEKEFKFEYDKRMVVKTDDVNGEVIDTLPWGYQHGGADNPRQLKRKGEIPEAVEKKKKKKAIDGN